MIKGSCFHLRHVKKDDVQRLLELNNRLELRGDYISMELMLPGTAEKKFEEESRSKDVRETFLIVDAEDTILGTIFHFKTVPYYNGREIGYTLFAQNLRGKGVMTEAVRLLTDYLFKTMLINRLEIHMNVANVASEKVAINCGYLKEGIARGASFSRGKHIDVAIYALLRHEWEQLSG